MPPGAQRLLLYAESRGLEINTQLENGTAEAGVSHNRFASVKLSQERYKERLPRESLSQEAFAITHLTRNTFHASRNTSHPPHPGA